MSGEFSDGGHPLYATMSRCMSTNNPSRSSEGHPDFLTRKRTVSTPMSREVLGSDDVIERVATSGSVINEASESDDDDDDDAKSDYVFYSPAVPSSPASPPPPPAAAAACHVDCRNRAQSAGVDNVLRPRQHSAVVSHSCSTQSDEQLQLHVSNVACFITPTHIPERAFITDTTVLKLQLRINQVNAAIIAED